VRKSISVLALILCVSLVLAACGSTASLTGKWKDEATGRTIMEFQDNGTLKMYRMDQLKTTATYKVDGDKITLTVNGTEKKGTYKIEGNKLTLTESSPNQTKVYIKQ
jgi:Zn/Cd-binding protein ZinT